MSRSTYTPPEITVEEDPIPGRWTLFATSHGRKAIVGPRILRGNGVISIDVRHATKEAAEDAATKLRNYLASLGKEKAVKGEAMPEPRRKGFWED